MIINIISKILKLLLKAIIFVVLLVAGFFIGSISQFMASDKGQQILNDDTMSSDSKNKAIGREYCEEFNKLLNS